MPGSAAARFVADRAAALAACCLAVPALAVPPFAPSPARAANDGLVWHVERHDGAAEASHRADEPINPASIVKIATSLWALERLCPGHRFVTGFGIRGSLDGASGVLDGDLIVIGGGDPDFHVENAYLVARELNRRGLRRVRGAMLVDDRFWLGWEGGSERRERDPQRRALSMGRALRDALDPVRWDDATRAAIARLRDRHALQAEPLAAVVVQGDVTRHDEVRASRLLVEHRSNPLAVTLKRLNAYSNNDIDRLGDGLGPLGALETYLARRLGAVSAAAPPTLASYSGLGSNRMSCRQIVGVLRELDRVSAELGLGLGDLLPVSGCDPGTLQRFPGLGERERRGALVAKTGTLARTDGGVAVLAGSARAADGEWLFCVASPTIGRELARARDEQQRWVLDLLERHGGARAGACGAAVVHSDTFAEAGMPATAPAPAAPPATPPRGRAGCGTASSPGR